MLSREGNHPAAGQAREFGEYLVAEGLISEGQAAAARDRCRAERGSLSKSIVSLGYLSADEVARAGKGPERRVRRPLYREPRP